MARWLGIDPGRKRIGVAVGSTEDGLATPVKVLEASPASQALEQIAALARAYEVEGIVVGLAVNMDDTEGPQAASARQLARRIAETTGKDVRLWDERLSSFTADKALAGHLTRKKRRRRQDAVAASVILKDFLARGGPVSAPRPGDAGPGT